MRYGGDTKDVLQRARAAGVSRMTVIGTRAADSEAAVQLSEHEEGVFCAVGIHPNDVDDVDEKEWGRIENLVGSGKVSAIGETGLDWFRTFASKEISNYFLIVILVYRKQQSCRSLFILATVFAMCSMRLQKQLNTSQ